jgi:hypothetical protein
MEKIVTIIGVFLSVLVVDFVGFCVWFLSGQIPPTDIFIGSITKHVLLLIIG